MSDDAARNSSKLSLEVRDQILLMRICRPPASNLIGLDMLQQLAHAYTQLRDARELRCGIVYAEGELFTTGLDLASALPRMLADGSGAYLEPGQCDPLALFGPPCSKPIIFSVHHRCFTAGLELVLAADMCVAAKGTVFRQHEVTRGVFPFGGATIRLPQRVGWGNAMRLLLAADSFDADEGARLGIVQVVAEPGRHLEDAIALAQRVCACAPLGVQAALANARMAASQGVQAAIDDMQERGRHVAASQDALEGIASMVQRRAAQFTGQ